MFKLVFYKKIRTKDIFFSNNRFLYFYHNSTIMRFITNLALLHLRMYICLYHRTFLGSTVVLSYIEASWMMSDHVI